METLEYASDIFARSHAARLQAEALVARALGRHCVAGPIRYSATVIDRARATRAEARVARSVSVTTRVRTLDAHHPALAARLISGSSDVAVAHIMITIKGAFLCDSCIGKKTGLGENDIATMLAHIGKTVSIRIDFGRCDGCLRADLLRRLG